VPAPEVTAHHVTARQPRAAKISGGRALLVLLTLLFAVELLWVAVIAYLLFRLL
jgi:hypothetical protein